MTNTLTIGEKIARDLCEMDPPAGDSIEVDPVDVARRIDDFASTLAAQIEMLREALTLIALDDCCTDPALIAQKALSTTPNQALEEFAAKVREQCAKLCDDLVSDYPSRTDITATQCADAIRAIKELP